MLVGLPPADHLPSPRVGVDVVVLDQHGAQDLHRGQLAQPGWRRLGVDRTQQGQRVAAIEPGEPLTLGRRGGQPPGIDPGPVAGAPLADLDHAGQPVRGRGREGFQTGPHRLPGQLQPVEITHRRGHVGGIGALLAAGPDHALGRQHLKHLVEHHLFQAVFDQPGAELAQLTRAKRLVVLVGSRKALAIAVRTAGTGRRHTALTHRLQSPATTRP